MRSGTGIFPFFEMTPKLKYLLTSILLQFSKDRFNCPSCGGSKSKLESRKYFVTSLRRCYHCKLLFRTPTTTAEENASFYQEAYKQGFTTDVPSEVELQKLIDSKFVGSVKDYTKYINILKALDVPPGARIVDFGCSWGYGSWQMQQAGYEVTSFEISKPRCRYAREKLGVNVYDNLTELPGTEYDVFFSSHVLEHVPSAADVIQYARTKVKKGGLFVAITPNAFDGYRHTETKIWQFMWGLVHPTMPDAQFYKNTFPHVVLASTPFNPAEIKEAWQAGESTSLSPVLSGPELVAITRL